ncbi:TenA family transcriptional regulator [Burkholderia ubonensis]|uniref:TenA family transcriptional regulator n=1 Tax=Burkholderia ubonensis TaxID=101571 RepID=UPI0009B38B43|nr:iron-containing redox enzyme family protein [Burkholderia ubonensis]
MKTPIDIAIKQSMIATPDFLSDESARAAKQLSNHPFLVNCRNGLVTRRQLEIFLIQHFKYSIHFTRLLCALMSNLSSPDDCVRIAENLCEEIGLAGAGDVPHSTLYAQMLEDFGVNPGKEEVLAETRNFIDTMYMLCRHPDPAMGLGAMCLGAEAIVPQLYSDLLAGFVALGIEKTRLTFFTLHIECDDGHADTMRTIMRQIAARDPGAAVRMVTAGDIALSARERFLDRLHLEIEQPGSVDEFGLHDRVRAEYPSDRTELLSVMR